MVTVWSLYRRFDYDLCFMFDILCIFNTLHLYFWHSAWLILCLWKHMDLDSYTKRSYLGLNIVYLLDMSWCPWIHQGLKSRWAKTYILSCLPCAVNIPQGVFDMNCISNPAFLSTLKPCTECVFVCSLSPELLCAQRLFLWNFEPWNDC